MGTRSGNVDPTIIAYASQQLGKSESEIVDDLNKRSGLKGICGDNDMRAVISKANGGDTDAKLAIEMFIYILSKQIAGLIVACGCSIDALVFTAGIGEHSSFVRSLVLRKIGTLLGAEMNDEWNESDGKLSNGIISKINKRMTDRDCVVLVVPTDEESMIFYDCKRVAGITLTK
jgi:acetate kinase